MLLQVSQVCGEVPFRNRGEQEHKPPEGIGNVFKQSIQNILLVQFAQKAPHGEVEPSASTKKPYFATEQITFVGEEALNAGS